MQRYRGAVQKAIEEERVTGQRIPQVCRPGFEPGPGALIELNGTTQRHKCEQAVRNSLALGLPLARAALDVGPRKSTLCLRASCAVATRL